MIGQQQHFMDQLAESWHKTDRKSEVKIATRAHQHAALWLTDIWVCRALPGLHLRSSLRLLCRSPHAHDCWDRQGMQELIGHQHDHHGSGAIALRPLLAGRPNEP